MEIFKKKSIVLKIVIAVVFVILFNFCSPTVSLGADGLLEQIGGTLVSPIVDLLVSIGDGAIYLIQSIMFGMSESTVKVSTVSNDWFDGVATFLMGALAIAAFILVPGFGAGIAAALITLGVTGYAASVIKDTWLPETFYLPLYVISPEEIFQNKIALLDVNFFNPNKYDPIETSVGVDGEQQTSTAALLQGTISSWYLTLRNLALVVLLSVLVYIGIRIIISSTAQDKAKYKEKLFSWGVAVALLFFMHYIMAFATTIVESISEGINKANVPVILVMPDLTDYYIETKDYERDENGNIKNVDENGEPIGEPETVKVDANQFFSENLTDANGQYVWPTNLMGKVRLDMQLEMPESSEDNILLRKLGYTVLFLILVFYTIAFLVVYIKRVIMLAFLTMIAPLVAMTYPLDKMKDGNAQAFNMWVKEYVFNLLIQPLHLILYTMLVGSAITMAATEAQGQDANINMIYAIVAIGFIFQSEKILRKFFGFDQASTLENGSAIGGALAMATVHQLGKLNRIGGKGGKGKKGGQNGDGKKNDRVRTADRGRSTRDLLAAQGNNEQDSGQRNDRDEVMERYGAEGYGQNANGEYFNPYTDEYDPNYDPHTDSSYAQFNRNPSSSGNSTIDNPPVSGTIRTAQTETEEPWNIRGWTEDDTRGAGAYIRDSWRNSGLRDNLNNMRDNIANNRYVRAIGAAGAGAADRARRAGRAVGDFGRGVHDLAGRGVRMIPKPIRNTIRGATGAVGRAAIGTASVVGGRIKEKLPEAGRLIARGAAGAALGLTAGTIGVAAGLASGDDKNILSMGAAGLGTGAALGSGIAGSVANSDIKGNIDRMASEYTIKTKGIEAEEQRQNRIADQAAMKDKERQKLYKEKLELDSKADVKAALEDAQKYRESGITDDKLIIKAMKAKEFESERASDERIILAGLAQETGNDQKKIDQVQKRLEDRGFDSNQIKKYIDGIRDINKAI